MTNRCEDPPKETLRIHIDTSKLVKNSLKQNRARARTLDRQKGRNRQYEKRGNEDTVLPNSHCENAKTPKGQKTGSLSARTLIASLRVGLGLLRTEVPSPQLAGGGSTRNVRKKDRKSK